MSEQIFNFIINALIPFVAVVLATFVIPYIKTLIGEKNLAQYKEWATLGVKCAEMVFTETHKGVEKKAYVVEFLNNLINKKKQVLTEQEINVLIESAVKAMKDAEIK